MLCEKFEDRLQSLWDRHQTWPAGSLRESSEFQTHLQQCAHCRETLAGFEALGMALDIGPPAPRNDLADRVLAQLASQSESRETDRSQALGGMPSSIGSVTRCSSEASVHVRVRIWQTVGRRLAVVAVSTAALVLVLGPSLRAVFQPSVPDRSLTTAASLPPENEIADQQKGASQLQSPMAPRELGNGEAGSMLSLEDRMSNENLRIAFQQWAARFPADKAAEQLDSVNSITRPITSSFSIAIGALRKTIPVGRDPAEPSKPQAGALRPILDGFIG